MKYISALTTVKVLDHLYSTCRYGTLGLDDYELVINTTFRFACALNGQLFQPSKSILDIAATRPSFEKQRAED